MQEEDDDATAAQTPMIATLAGAMVAVASLCSAAAGLQLLVVVQVYGWVRVLPFILVLLGVAGLGTGGLLTRARAWAAIASALVAGGLALAGLFWVVWALRYGFFAPLPLIAAALSGFAALITPFAVLPCVRVERARKKLYA